MRSDNELNIIGSIYEVLKNKCGISNQAFSRWLEEPITKAKIVGNSLIISFKDELGMGIFEIRYLDRVKQLYKGDVVLKIK